MALLCVVGPGRVRIEARRRGRVRWAAEANWKDPAELRVAVADLAGHTEISDRERTVAFLVEEGVCQRRVLDDLPPVPRRELVQLVRLAPHRFFRRAGTALIIDAGWSGPRAARRAIAIALDAPVAEALVRGAAEAGLAVVALGPAGPKVEASLSLLPPHEVSRRVAARLRWTRRLGVAAVAAWVALAALAVGRTLLERRRIAARLDALRNPVAAVLAAESASDSAVRMVRRLDDEAAHEGDVAATLFRVTLALPDSSFLTQVRIDSTGVGLIAGAARRPTAVLAALESRGGVFTPRLEGRTSQDLIAGRPVERFAIGFGATGDPR